MRQLLSVRLSTSLRVATLAVLWGSTFLWIKVSLDNGLAPTQIVVIRCTLAAAVLLGLARWMRQPLPRDLATWRKVVVAALLCNAIPFALFSVGEQTVDSGVAGVVHATTPLWSMVVGLAVGSSAGLNRVRRAGLVLGFAGAVVIFAPWTSDGLLSWGALAILGAAASYAVAFAYMGRNLVGRGGPVAMSAAQLSAAACLSAVALPIGGLDGFDATTVGLVAVSVLGVFATAVTFYLNYRVIEDEGATAAATVGYLLPVVSVLLGALVLGEELSGRIVAGMAVVLVGVAMTRAAVGASRADEEKQSQAGTEPVPAVTASART